MKGVNNKLAVNAAGKTGNQSNDKAKRQSQSKRKKGAKTLTAGELRFINRRLDQCLPMETPEWQRVEQLLMQISEFAPRLLVYEAGMAVALYADDQARRAYMLGAEDARAEAESNQQSQNRNRGLVSA